LADDTAAQTDGPDAVRAMSNLVQVVCPVLEWTGRLVKTKKSKIVGVDMKTVKSIETDYSDCATARRISIQMAAAVQLAEVKHIHCHLTSAEFSAFKASLAPITS
jgi:hypothetical protein